MSDEVPVVDAKSPSKVRCEEYLTKVLSHAHINFVRLRMGDLGCDTFNNDQGKHNFEFSCEPCQKVTAGDSPTPPQHLGLFTVDSETNKKKIFICEENFSEEAAGRMSASAVRRTVLHELIHAYDYCRVKFDINNCDQLACTEVRAAMLSGDCTFVSEITRMNFGIAGQGAACAKRRAILSLEGNPVCQSTAKEAVDRVFDKCHKDTAPFFMKF
ncbi:hypothetical protein BASA81_003789 [Batrachochytrium salamandrivorans]|nr:hypothetical protein BASA81_003789 [Batrachochytrium salamandrivorans]